MIQYNII